MDYYAILGVHPTAEDIVIRAAYKALAQRYHPDRFTGSKDEAHRRMSDLTKAYEVLADPVRRQKYDRRRLTYTQSVATYFNGSAKFPPPALDPRDLRRAAATRKRSRVALSALMLAVVALSAFNLFQYSAQLKDWLSVALPAPPPAVEASSRRMTDASASAAVGAASGDSSQTPAAARAGNLSLDHGSATPADVAPNEVRVSSPPRPDASSADAPLAVGPGEITPRQPASDANRVVALPDAAPLTAASLPVAPSPAAPPVPALPAVAPLATSPPAANPLPKEARPVSTAAARARRATLERPITTPPSAPATESCREAVAALGLCNPSTTARNK